MTYVDNSVGSNIEFDQTGGIGQNGVSEAAKEDFAELVKQTIRDQLAQQGVTLPPGSSGEGELSPEAEQKLEEGLASGDLSEFIEQMVKEALEEAGLTPDSSAQQQGGGSGGAGSPEALTEQIMEALQQSGGSSGGDLGEMIGEQVDKMVQDALEEADVTPDDVQGNTAQQVGGNVPPDNFDQIGDDSADALFDSQEFNNRAATFLSDNNSYEEANQVIDPENTIFGGDNDFGIETPDIDLSEADADDLQFEQSTSSSTVDSIDRVNTYSNTQLNGNDGNRNVTAQDNDDQISNAA